LQNKCRILNYWIATIKEVSFVLESSLRQKKLIVNSCSDRRVPASNAERRYGVPKTTVASYLPKNGKIWNIVQLFFLGILSRHFMTHKYGDN
jgi:hypothetical protein